MSAEPVAQPLVGFRRWGAKRGGLYSGIFVAGMFVQTRRSAWSRRASSQMPWPTDHDRFAKCFALRGHDAPHPRLQLRLGGVLQLAEQPELPAIECVWGAVVAWGKSSSTRRAFAPSSPARSRCWTCATPTTPRARPAPGNAAEAYGIPLLERDELIAYAAWHGEVRAA